MTIATITNNNFFIPKYTENMPKSWKKKLDYFDLKYLIKSVEPTAVKPADRSIVINCPL